VVTSWIEAQTGWPIRKFVKTARPYRTIEVQAGRLAREIARTGNRRAHSVQVAAAATATATAAAAEGDFKRTSTAPASLISVPEWAG
jgi:hypothetical protein